MNYSLNGFYNEDCLTAMRTFPDKYFDIAVCDPPYGIRQAGEKNKSRSKLATARDYVPYYGNDEKPPDDEYFAELFRISKHQVIFGANHFISRMPFDASCWIVWDKQNGDNDFADCELAWTSFHCAVRRFAFRWQGMIQGNMKDKEIRIHANQKPVALYTWVYMVYKRAVKNAPQRPRLLDTHVGSASSLIAAHYGGFDYIGFEIDAGYYKLASERLEAQTAQLSLFTEGDE